jgi:BirA family biotin operon repressor/biotin-[acetyl-CoA-carboxylase] ligase
MDWGKDVLSTAPHGTLLLSDDHATPRGRHGRQWYYQPGELMLTYILKPEMKHLRTTDPIHSQPLSSLFMALTNSVLNVLRTLEPNCLLKWPNDVFLYDKKVCGIIVEPVWEGSRLIAAIVGIGANINNTFSEGGPLSTIATSITMHTKQQYDLQKLRLLVSKELNAQYTRWQNSEYEYIYQQWRQAQGYMSANVTVHTNDGMLVTGIMHDVYPNGDLGLKQSDGKVRHLPFTQVAFWDVP